MILYFFKHCDPIFLWWKWFCVLLNLSRRNYHGKKHDLKHVMVQLQRLTTRYQSKGSNTMDCGRFSSLGHIPPWIACVLGMACLLTMIKPLSGVHPIVVMETLYRLTSHALCFQFHDISPHTNWESQLKVVVK